MAEFTMLEWDATGERLYQTGVDHVILFPQVPGGYAKGVAWNGVTSITDKASGAEANPVYADNIKYLNLTSAEDFGVTIEALTYPDEFAPCNGFSSATDGVYVGMQNRQHFGLAYRTLLGDDQLGTELGYKMHLVYNCQAAPSEEQHQTVNESPEPGSMSWEVNTTPVVLTSVNPATQKVFKPTAHLVIDSTKCAPGKWDALVNKLIGKTGTDGNDPTLPTPDQVIALLKP